jgi:hypothetical protein
MSQLVKMLRIKASAARPYKSGSGSNETLIPQTTAPQLSLRGPQARGNLYFVVIAPATSGMKQSVLEIASSSPHNDILKEQFQSPNNKKSGLHRRQ